MKANTKEEVKGYYSEKEEAQTYMKNRLSAPVYIVEHEIQAEFINKQIKQNKAKNILEIGCGPGRLTKEVNMKGLKGTAMDYSKEMLKIAEDIPGWTFTWGDAFKYQSNKKFDLVFSYRFFFHFKEDDRKRLYKTTKSTLKPSGVLLFEARNKVVAGKIKKLVKKFFKTKYKIYQKLYEREELIQELKDNGFVNIELHDNLRHFFIQSIISKFTRFCPKFGVKIIRMIEKIPGEPFSWNVKCAIPSKN